MFLLVLNWLKKIINWSSSASVREQPLLDLMVHFLLFVFVEITSGVTPSYQESKANSSSRCVNATDPLLNV